MKRHGNHLLFYFRIGSTVEIPILKLFSARMAAIILLAVGLSAILLYVCPLAMGTANLDEYFEHTSKFRSFPLLFIALSSSAYISKQYLKSSTPSFSIPENWSTEFEVTENEDEFIEPTTKVRVFCNFASNGSQYAELRVILSTGENHNVGTLRRGEEFKFKYLDKKFRIYLVKVINGEPHDTAILKLERLP